MRAFDIFGAVGGTFFGAEYAEVTCVSTDSRATQNGSLFIAIKGERFDGNRFIDSAYEKGATVVIGNADAVPPKDCAYIRVLDSLAALGKLAAWHRQQFSIPLVGITGSVGKTTTKEMIAAVLSTTYHTLKTEGNFNNHIGLPLTALKLGKDHGAAVLEMGMSARGEISYLTKIAKPTVAVITNIGLSHIENLGSQENIRDAKLEIAEGLDEGGPLFVNGDDPFLEKVTLPKSKVVRYGFENPAAEIRGTITGENSFTVDGVSFSVPVAGKHNLYNALAAYAVGRACGVSAEKAAEGILKYKTDGVRQSEVEIRPDITVICDYYNASPASVAVALEMLSKGKAKRRIAVLGDMLELGTFGEKCHAEIGEKAAAYGIDMLLSVGELSRFTAKSAKACGVPFVESFPDNAALSRALLSILEEGDRVLIKGSHGMKMEEIFEKIR